MAEITGGELNYAVTVDVDQLKKSLTDAEGNLQGFSDVAELAGEKLDNALKGEVVENLKKIGIQSGLTGRDMKDALKDAENFVKVLNSGLRAAIKTQEKLFDEINKLPAGNAQAVLLEEYAKGEEDLVKITEAVQVASNVVQRFKDDNASLTVKLRLVKEEMEQLIQLGQKDSEKYSELSAKAQEYTQNIDQLNAEMKALSGNPGLDLFIESVGLASGVFATTQGVMGLLVGESENLDKVMVQMQATMSVAIGLQQIQNALKSDGTVITRVMAIQELARGRATDIGTAATGRAAVAQRLWNLVANANPYILLATAIITVVGAIAIYVAATNEAEARTKKLVDLNKAIADSVAEPLVAYRNLQGQWNALGNDLKAKEKFVKDNKDAFEKLGVEVNNVTDAENVLQKNSGAFIEAMMLRAKSAALAQMAVENMKKSLLLESEYKRKNIDKNLTVGESLLKTLNGGVGGITANRQAKSDAEEVRKSLQNNVDLAAEQLKVEKELEALNKKAGFRTPTKIEKEKKAAKEKVTKEKKADEYFPPGSVAEIQKRMAAIDEALSKATNSSSIAILKNKRIAITQELAEAVKKIEIKSLEDRANEQEKYSVAYGVIAEKYGKETADKMYAPLMEGAQSYYGWLDQEREKLFQKNQSGSLLSEADKENLVFLTQKINEIEGKKNAFQNFTDGIDEALSKIPTLSGQIEFLQNKAEEQLSKKGNKSFDNGEQKYLKEQADQRLKQIKDNYQTFLAEHKTFEEKKIAITKKYDELRASDTSGKNKTVIDNAEKEELSKLSLEIFKTSKDWEIAFGNMQFVSQSTLRRIIKSMEEFRAANAKNLQPTELREITETINKLKEATNINPFKNITEGIKEWKDALGPLKQAIIDQKKAQEDYNATLSTDGKETENSAKAREKLADANKKLSEAELKMSDSQKKVYDALKKGQEYFNDAIGSVRELDDAFGFLGDAGKDAIKDIEAVGNSLFELGKGVLEFMATGNPTGLIKGAISAISAIGKALSGDAKKERNIKKQAAVLKQLELAYNDVAFAAERMFGSQKYSGQTDLIRNLEQQKIAIEGMMRSEQSKKKADNEKIAGYQSQIQSINQSIATIKEGIIKDVLQTDIVDAAAKLGDALVDNFGRGEDALKSLQTAANDVIKNLLKNQLNLLLQNKMKPILDKLLRDAGFNADGTGSFIGLTPEQIAEFKAKYIEAGQSMQGFLDAFPDIFGGAQSASEGIKGDIKGITEKTAGALEAQVNALRIYQVEGLNIQKSNQLLFVQSLQNLVLIEFNTRPLHRIDKNLEEMNGKMSKNLVGFP